MGLLSLSNPAIYVKKAEFSGFKALKWFQNDPNFNLGQLNAYKLMFAIKLSMEKRINNFWSAGFSYLPAINATSFTTLTGFSSVLDRSSKDQHFLNG